ncbi:MAG: hypothetical protein KME08_14515 [Aphanothece sp. CMT-3BRIN-NPC111]|jgi:hypothetical protein|nr:hypothetical protein [Aphanothece sp. CMT-3BRIN-NPC111]
MRPSFGIDIIDVLRCIEAEYKAVLESEGIQVRRSAFSPDVATCPFATYF